jgi:hypothetical protein
MKIGKFIESNDLITIYYINKRNQIPKFMKMI